MTETRTREPGAGKLAGSRRVAAYVLLVTVMGCVAAASWAGLYAYARYTLGWGQAHAVLVPIALDVAAMTCALLGLDSIAKGETGGGFRVLTAAFVALSAFVNWRRAITTGNLAEQVFFPSMSVLAYALVHEVFAKYRREVARDLAGHAHRAQVAKLPRLGAAWARYPGRAFKVTTLALADRIARAEREYVGGVSDTHPDTPATRGDTRTDAPAVAPEAAEIAGLSQADAIRAGRAAVGDRPRDVIAWLDSHGRTGVPSSRVNDVIRRDQSSRPRLAPVTQIEQPAANGTE